MYVGGSGCCGNVRLSPALQKPLAKLRRATSGLRRNLHTRSANLFLPATASPPVFVLLSDRFSSHFPGCSFDVEWLSSLLQSCHFHSLFHSNCVVFTLFRVLRVQDTHFDCSCWSKNDRLSRVQTCDCLMKTFLKLYKTRTECTVSGNNLDRRSCSPALAPFCPCRETFREAPVDTSDLRIVLKLPFKYDPACSK